MNQELGVKLENADLKEGIALRQVCSEASGQVTTLVAVPSWAVV